MAADETHVPFSRTLCVVDRYLESGRGIRVTPGHGMNSACLPIHHPRADRAASPCLPRTIHAAVSDAPPSPPGQGKH